MQSEKQRSDKPTGEQFRAYQRLFDYFNEQLFAGALPPILLNFSRKAGTCGFFSANRWKAVKSKDTTHEISINPLILASEPFIQVCQTLVHEQAHLWQCVFGKPSRQGYHNSEWAAKMEEIGLMPTDTGQPDGKKVGQKMSDYVIDGGRFAEVFRSLPESFVLPWRAIEPRELKAVIQGAQSKGNESESEGAEESEDNAKRKRKYHCPECKAKVWGKAGLQIMCMPCTAVMEEADK